MRHFFGSLLVSSMILAAPLASAQTVEKPTPPPAAEESHKQFAVNLNPLSWGIGRYGADFQWLPVAHHAIVVNPFYASTTADVENNGLKYQEKFSGFGGEVGYRLYTSERGASGFFVGPSLILGTYTASANDQKVAFNSIGYAFDIGGQAMLKNGITIGGGFGLQNTKVNKDFTDLPLNAAILAGGGWRPRFLFSIGYAFG